MNLFVYLQISHTVDVCFITFIPLIPLCTLGIAMYGYINMHTRLLTLLLMLQSLLS